jgi:hypothetical protein
MLPLGKGSDVDGPATLHRGGAAEGEPQQNAAIKGDWHQISLG